MDKIMWIFIIISSLLIATVKSGMSRDVLYMPRTLLAEPLAQSTIEITNPTIEISACAWIKSLNIETTGTVFTIANRISGNREFGLVQFNSGDNTNHYDVYVVVNNVPAQYPVQLKLDDVRWHHVCITWSNGNGKWAVYLDGDVIGKGKDLETGHVINADIDINIGGDRDLVKFAGKLTDFFVWNRFLSESEVKKLSNCDPVFRRSLRNNLLGEEDDLQLRWTQKSVLFVWGDEYINVLFPANMRRPEKICNKEVVVDCEPGRMLVSIQKRITDGLNIKPRTLHLNEPSCEPTIRGQNDEYLVFQISDLNQCGNKREVTSREVIYSNKASNSPTKPSVLYMGHLFRVAVQCRFPIHINVTMARMTSSDDAILVGRSTLENALTNEKSLQVITMIFEDDSFTKAYKKRSLVGDKENVFVGMVLEDTGSNMKMVADKCWLSYDGNKVDLIDTKRCGKGKPNIASILENGMTSQVRFQVPSVIFPRDSPSYITCAVYSCAGLTCQPTCGTISPTGVKRFKRGLARSTSSGSISYVRIGPIYTTKREQVKNLKNKIELQETRSIPAIIITALVVLGVIATITCFMLLWILCKRHRRCKNEEELWRLDKNLGSLCFRTRRIRSYYPISIRSSFPNKLSLNLNSELNSYKSIDIPYQVNI